MVRLPFQRKCSLVVEEKNISKYQRFDNQKVSNYCLEQETSSAQQLLSFNLDVFLRAAPLVQKLAKTVSLEKERDRQKKKKKEENWGEAI